MDVLAVMVLFLSFVYHSDASYCVCNNGVSDSVLQKNIDFACGAGADCTPIQQNGACFNPNTVKDHCNYAVNSYYQKKGQAPGSCDFQSTATVTPNPPSAGSGCVFQSNPSTGGATTTPPTTPTIGGTPTTPTTPTTGGGMPTTPTTGGGTTNTPGTTVPGTSTNPGFGVGPTTGGGFGTPDSSGAGGMILLSKTSSATVFSIAAALLASNFM
ncbi:PLASMODESMATA CALLOSE-BINDING PROTEIN 3-like [Andrographis paniculata]|uniref:PLASMODESMATA CALLOSE-BINDING PROTEIN 3-like n=1 Tax=Andrographis paniculata TaxID=175694 RepID=UPI0021E8FD4F|nr:PLASMODESMATA CALLOSE-BINDING PROTEIN 3-like [Andrographis paniculata]